MVNNSLFNKSNLPLATDLLTMAGGANASYSSDITDSSYIKVYVRSVSGGVSTPVVNNLGV
jgi:hypothetical protein